MDWNFTGIYYKMFHDVSEKRVGRSFLSGSGIFLGKSSFNFT